MKKYLLSLLTLLVVAVSCNKQEPEIFGDITLDKTELQMSSKAVSAMQYLTIKSTYEWNAVSDADWITMSQTMGQADKEYKILVRAQTNGDPVAREASITISSGKSHKTVKVVQERGALVITPDQIPDYNKIYVPKEYEKEDFFSSDGMWFFGRSAQSEHFILFWDPDYGDGVDTNPGNVAKYKVDVKALLNWAESCYQSYVNVFKFAEEGHSILDKHKINIFLYYPTNWTTPGAAATGAGLENQVGCLWLDGQWATDKPILAHEIGHSFQYIVGCDKLYNKETTNVNTYSFRYDIGQGNGFWEQTSQWMAYMMVPGQTFTNYNFSDYCKGVYKHLLHEDNRYSNYFIHHYMTDRYGIEAVGEVWKNARSPKDALEVYMSVHDLSVAEFNQHVYEYASRVATWDFDGLRKDGINYINKIAYKSTKGEDGYYKVDASTCPEATGFNVIRLQNYVKGSDISIDFVGLPNEPGYNKSGTATDGGWTIGFVALSSDNTTRYYSPTAVATADSDYKTTISWTIPEDTKRLWAVVAATPVKYISHKWDENNSNDRHWPYKMAVEGATPSNI